MIYEEIRLPNGMFVWAPPGVEKPRELTPSEKVTFERKQTLLTEKAEARQDTCWRYGCDRAASVWVREVGFDFKGDKADPLKHVAISSADYEGPVPGFCRFCIWSGPQELTEAVYFARPEMFWGVRPKRWFVSFTDGTKQGGSCIEIDPKQELPTIIEEHISGT